jgi:hypothetical protein
MPGSRPGRRQDAHREEQSVPHRLGTPAAILAVALLTGCGDVSADDVDGVATTFAGAEDDPASRCELLASATLEAVQEEGPCDDAIADLPLGSGEVTAVEVWGEEAQVRLADDTLFLTRTADGWRVSAAACTPQGEDLPYDCRLEAS